MSFTYGHGPYDALSIRVMNKNRADGAMIFVLGGKDGSGYSITTAKLQTIHQLPALLREAASDLEKQNAPLRKP